MNDDYVKRSDVHKAFQPKYAPAINRTFAAMIDSVPAADVVERPRWHNVTETPPLSVGDPDYYGYLVYSCGYVRVADFTANEFHVDGEYDPDVTHWLPLQPPPEGDA